MFLDLAALALLMALGQFSPGPDMLLITHTVMAHGRRAAFFCIAGITTGLLVHATLALTGTTWIATNQPATWRILQAVAGLYLLWLAWAILRPSLAKSNQSSPDNPSRSPLPSNSPMTVFYRRGLTCNLLNGKALIFFASIVVPFHGPERPGFWPFAIGTLIVIEGLLLWNLWALLLDRPPVRRFYSRFALWISIFFALAMATLGLLLLFSPGDASLTAASLPQ